MRKNLLSLPALLLLCLPYFAGSGSTFGQISQADSLKKKPIQNNDSLKVSPDYYKLLPHAILKDEMAVRTLTSGNFIRTDYRYTGNILTLAPFSFLQDFGSPGQPHEILLYGLGNGNINHSVNGISNNNPWENSLDAHFIQSEMIDSIEVAPITSGFLYNSMNNPVNVNYISKGGLKVRPYSRIRFFQSSNEEGLIDAIFNAEIYKKTFILAEITNSSVDSRGEKDANYNNSYGLWKVSSSVKYILTDKSILDLTFKHAKENIDLNGGVLKNSSMYDANGATVIYPYRSQTSSLNNLSLNYYSELLSGSPLYITLYHNYYQQKFKQDVNNNIANTPYIRRDDNSRIYGANYRQELNFKIFELNVQGNYEHSNIYLQKYDESLDVNNLSASARLKLNLFDAVFPSVFIKSANYRKVQFNGFGTESTVEFGNHFRLSGGLSYFEKPFSIIENKLLSNSINKQKLSTVELNAGYYTNDFKAVGSAFMLSNDKFPLPVLNRDNDSLLINETGLIKTDKLSRSGFNLLCDFKVWNLEFTNNASYYINHESNKFNSLPEFSLQGGIYYIDTLFQNNLYLKAGINYKISGSKPFVTYDFENSIPVAYYTTPGDNSEKLISSEIIPSASQLDFFVAATVQKKAIVYFVFENLLDNNYYLMPYYPMYARAMRFGISWEFFD